MCHQLLAPLDDKLSIIRCIKCMGEQFCRLCFCLRTYLLFIHVHCVIVSLIITETHVNTIICV